MKKILIPYDFSESCSNALDYATGLAKIFSSELVLLSVNHYPIMTPEVGLSAFAFQNSQEESLTELKKVAEKVTRKEPSISVVCYSEIGELGDVIRKLCLKVNAGLIVMGISGHGDKFIKTLAGSSAVTVAKDQTIPVLIIPPGTQFKKPTRIAFASRYGEDEAHEKVTGYVRNFCKSLNADLHIIHIVPENHPVKHTEVLIDNYAEHKLEESIHRTFIMTEKNVHEGLLDVLKNNLVDMVIIEPKKHGFFENLFHKSVTTEIAFNSPVPVMCIHFENT